MGHFSNDNGTQLSFFEIGGPTGPGINANGAALEVRNSANAAFAVMRGADPVAANDFVTLESLATVKGPVNLVKVNVGLTTTASTAILPAGAVVRRVFLDVTTGYTAGATISVGAAGSVSAYMTTAQNSPAVIDKYEVSDDPASVNAAVLVTLAGTAATVGACVAYVEYAVPLT